MSAQPSAPASVLPSSYASLWPQEATLSVMRMEDIPDVMQAEREVYLWPWSEGNVRDSIQKGHHCQVLRNTPGQLLGYFMAMPGAGEVHLLNITVAPAFQRQGWARVMLDALHLWAREQEAQWVWLEVRVSNTRAIGIYEAYGFRLQREDAIVMSNLP
jgi:[ribosomal protein S18]-alanine N-acetyltransferase